MIKQGIFVEKYALFPYRKLKCLFKTAIFPVSDMMYCEQSCHKEDKLLPMEIICNAI